TADIVENETIVSGPVNEKVNHPNITILPVVSAADMYEAVMNHMGDQDIIIKTAAVADYKPKVVHDQKMKKQTGGMTIELERTQDILQTVGEKKTNQFVLGFAAETENVIHYAQEKLKKKHLDAIIVND